MSPGNRLLIFPCTEKLPHASVLLYIKLSPARKIHPGTVFRLYRVLFVLGTVYNASPLAVISFIGYLLTDCNLENLCISEVKQR